MADDSECPITAIDTNHDKLVNKFIQNNSRISEAYSKSYLNIQRTHVIINKVELDVHRVHVTDSLKEAKVNSFHFTYLQCHVYPC